MHTTEKQMNTEYDERKQICVQCK